MCDMPHAARAAVVAALDRPGDGKALEPELPTVFEDHVLITEPVVGDPAVPFLQRDPHLQPGQVGALAAVRPGSEREVAVGCAIEHDRVGVGERTGSRLAM